MKQIAIARRDVKTWSDWTAFNLVRLLRWSTDFATGYRHQKEVKKLEKDPRAKRFVMTEQKWLTRFIFLESIAGVPGIVGGMLRHLRSLRRMQRDNGWFVCLSTSIVIRIDNISQDRESSRRSLQRTHAPPHLPEDGRTRMVHEVHGPQCSRHL